MLFRYQAKTFAFAKTRNICRMIFVGIPVQLAITQTLQPCNACNAKLSARLAPILPTAFPANRATPIILTMVLVHQAAQLLMNINQMEYV